MFIILVVLMAGVVYAQDMLVPSSQPVAAIRHSACPIIDDKLHPVMLPFPNDCTKYYSCLNGYAYTMKCPENLHWSRMNNRCDYPDVAKCERLTPYYPEQIPIYYSDPYNCNQYYQCQKMICPVNMYWNERAQRCDLSYINECSAAKYPFGPSPSGNMPPTASTPPAMLPGYPIEPITPSPSFVPTSAFNELNELCRQYKSITYISYPGDCGRFIQCNGVAFVHTCPANLYWNSMLKTCDTYCM